MAVDMFIKVGDIKGESVDSKHKDSIDVLSWSWGLSQSGTTHTGGGGGAGKVSVHDLSFTHYLDAASPNLFLACCDGSHYDDALLTVRKAGKEALEYLKISMKEVIVTSISTGGSGGEDRSDRERHRSTLARSSSSTRPRTRQGKGGGAITGAWNIAENIKAG